MQGAPRIASKPAVSALALLVGLVLVGGCTQEPAVEKSSADEAVVVAWARDDLGFGAAAGCVADRIRGVRLPGVTRDDLRHQRLDLIPVGDRQRIGDALVICGILESDHR